MAVWKMTDKPRRLPWRAKVKNQVKNFLTKQDAEFWERSQLQSITLTGLPLTIEALKKVTVGEIVERYLKEKTPLKGSVVSETTVLEKLLGFKNGERDPSRQRHAICDLSLAAIKKKDAHAYKNGRLKETWRGKPIAESTVKREMNTLHHIFEVAKEEWGYENLINPFDNMKLKDGHGRERRLQQGELEKLEEACKTCRGLNRHYIPLAIYLAIETGMRLQEIFNLLWSDIDVENRRIIIRKSKTDHVSKYKGRTIVLTLMAEVPLNLLTISLLKKRRFKSEGKVFPMRREAFKQSWADVVKRAKIEDLHFHDLRHEAGSRFDAAGLTHAEHGLMMGHGKRTMRDRYSHAALQSIQDKLDKHLLGGMTRSEAYQSAIAEGYDKIPKDIFYRALERVGTAGITFERAIELEKHESGQNVLLFPKAS
jgi:integrase